MCKETLFRYCWHDDKGYLIKSEWTLLTPNDFRACRYPYFEFWETKLND